MQKTVLLLYPHALKKGGQVWELLHIDKQKNTIVHRTEPVTQARKHFPRLPDELGSLLNKFSEKSMQSAKQEMIAAAKKQGGGKMDNEWFSNAFERKLHQDMLALKSFLTKLPCYHQAPVPGEKNRYKTAPCVFQSTTPALRFQVRRNPEGFLCSEPEVEINGSFFPVADFTQYSFLLELKSEYFMLRYTDYKTLCWLKELDWTEVGADQSRFTEIVIARLEPNYLVMRNDLLGGLQIETAVAGRILLSEVSGQYLMLTPQFEYDGFVVDGAFKDKVVVHHEGKEYKITRDKTTEESIRVQVEGLHDNFSKQLNGYYYLSFEDAQRKNWFLKAFRKLLQMDIQVVGMDMLKHFRYCHERPVTKLEIVKEAVDAVEISFSLFFGTEEIPLTDLQKVVRSGQQALALKDGSIALLEEEWLARYGIIVKHARIMKEQVTVPKWLAVSLDGESEPLHGIVKNDWVRRWQQWQSGEDILYPVPGVVNASLRAYQQKGFEWMRLLEEIGAGMLLADGTDRLPDIADL